MKVLVIAPHPDDETLGCGGTLLKHKEKGDKLHWFVMTTVYEDSYSLGFIKKRKQQIKAVIDAYGFASATQFDFSTAKLHNHLGDLIPQLSDAILRLKPEVLYTINRSDVHTDHQITAQAVASATKSFRCPWLKRIMMYETISETEIAPPFLENAFLPNVYVDITQHLTQKLKIMKVYDTELQQQPLPRSLENLEALARFRGASVSVPYAEAFMLVREIV
jgi:LmbE family N-acetylglucosaminyl deacetylase